MLLIHEPSNINDKAKSQLLLKPDNHLPCPLARAMHCIARATFVAAVRDGMSTLETRGSCNNLSMPQHSQVHLSQIDNLLSRVLSIQAKERHVVFPGALYVLMMSTQAAE